MTLECRSDSLHSFISRVCLHIIYRIRMFFREIRPRAIKWRYLRRKYPRDPIITNLMNGPKVRVYPFDIIGKRLYIDGVYEEAESLFITRFLEPGMVFFDIGANFGQYTLLAAERVSPNGRVHAFEPSRRMFAELNFNVKLNHFSSLCSLNELAISDNQRMFRFPRHRPGEEIYGALIPQSVYEAPIVGHDTIEAITLDNYIQQQHIRQVDLIKIDIEGAELLALRGAERLLSRPKAPVIVLEMYDALTHAFGYTTLDLWNHLEKHQYQLYEFDKQGQIIGLVQHPGSNSLEANLVAMKNP